jgi:deoxyribodipyrimidine photolyase-related protein
MKTGYVILGNQLIRNHPVFNNYVEGDVVIMIEAYDLCSKRSYHKHKLILLLSAMRNYRDYLRLKGLNVVYEEINDKNRFIHSLKLVTHEYSLDKLVWMKTSDMMPNKNLVKVCDDLKISHDIYDNQQFITSDDDFEQWYKTQKQPLMESFYRWQRKRTGILMYGGKPIGEKWNYDAENRKSLPKSGVVIPKPPMQSIDQNTKAVIKVVDELFTNNPGVSENFWLPTDFDSADIWLKDFIINKFRYFGDYEDASKEGEAFLFHSVLSPLINCGLLNPDTVVASALDAYSLGKIPLNSLEGFIRQIIGWREYMYGMYKKMPELINANYFGFTKQLEPWWYDKTYEVQDLPIPVKAALKTVHAYGYNHHIERLMVLGNWFLLN